MTIVTPHHMSHVMCHISCVRYQLSRVRCHVSHNQIMDKVVELVGGGSVIKGGIPRLVLVDPAMQWAVVHTPVAVVCIYPFSSEGDTSPILVSQGLNS